LRVLATMTRPSVQAALQEAYESGKLRGSQLIQARRVIERAAPKANHRRQDGIPQAE
jgi:hypothetical protein